MSNTPQTDAQVFCAIHVVTDERTSYVPADFARELERENARLRAALERAIDLLMYYTKDTHQTGSVESRRNMFRTALGKEGAK